MIWLILGLALWSAAHLFKRVAPEARARLGDPGKGAVALALVLAVVLMVIGVRGAPFIAVWTPPAFMTHINNLLVLIAFYLFAIAGQGVWLDRKIRHTMLTGMKTFALAHLLVNGDLVTMILFGGLMAWAVVEVILINRAEPEWTAPAPAVRRKEFTFPVATIVVFGVAAWIHSLLGYYPFPS
ncbi:MAG: hypothetical protein CSA72_00725 [Rhodobacterales bacterium]|nr:MAG: hypothetical protein CSA72_00725 [Rhodobacterales bacterium]